MSNSSSASSVSAAPKKRSAALEKNRHVKELMGILKANGMNEDAKGLSEVVGCISAMERDLGRAITELTAMRRDLSVMREEQSHPVKTMLSKAADGLIARLKAAHQRIQVIKEKIIGVCKRTVEAVKDQGITAANDIVGALNIKADLETQRDAMRNTITFCEKQVDKIESASKEFHAAGRHIRNIGRAITGKEPIADIKPNGKLARFIASPFRGEIQRQKSYIARNDRAITLIDKLEQAAELRAEKARPSVHSDMKRIKSEIDEVKKDAPKKQKLKTAEESL
ncbi:MAG: hypothetical protein FWE20_09995 [Defluviitaleaceae bacterium]|nr:hypothetical protein [Defluviitaleaceae bacterium]